MIILNKNNFNNQDESGVLELQNLARRNKIGIVLLDYETSLVGTCQQLRTINFYPCINFILTENIFSLNFSNGHYQYRKIAYSNISLEFTLRCIRIFLLKLKENYTNLKFFTENHQEDNETTKRIIDLLTTEFQKLEEDQNYSMVNFLNNYYLKFGDTNNNPNCITFSPGISILENKMNLKFNNYDEMVYLSRLKTLFESEVYFKPSSVRKKIKEELNYNDILYLLNLFVEGLVTLINSSLYSHLLLYQKSGINLKSLVRKLKIIKIYKNIFSSRI